MADVPTAGGSPRQNFPEPNALGSQLNPDIGNPFANILEHLRQGARDVERYTAALKQLNAEAKRGHGAGTANGGIAGSETSGVFDRISSSWRNAFSGQQQVQNGGAQPTFAQQLAQQTGVTLPAPNGGRRGGGGGGTVVPGAQGPMPIPDPHEGQLGQVARYYVASAAVGGVRQSYTSFQDYAYGMRPYTATFGGVRGMSSHRAEQMLPQMMNGGVVRGPGDMLTAMPTLMGQLGMASRDATGLNLAKHLSRSELSMTGGADAAVGLLNPALGGRLRGYGINASYERWGQDGGKGMIEDILKRANGGRAVTAQDLAKGTNSRLHYNVRQLVGAENADAIIRAGMDHRGVGGVHDDKFGDILATEQKSFRTRSLASDNTLAVMEKQREILTSIERAVWSIADGGAMSGMGALTQTLGDVLPWMLIGNRSKAAGAAGAVMKNATGLGKVGALAPAARAGWAAMGGFAKGGLMAGAAAIAADPLQSIITDENQQTGARDLAGGITAGALRGAGLGATLGLIGGPLAPITSGVGAAAGALIGGAIGGFTNRGEGDPPSSNSSSLVARSNHGASHVDGLNSGFRAKLEKMFADNPNLVLVSGYRSIKRQEQLWAEALRKYGSAEKARKWVAPPGKSNHNFGLAADIGPPSQYGWLKSNVGKYGLTLPLSNEPWHVEPIGIRSGRDKALMQMEASPATNASAGSGATGSVTSMATRVDIGASSEADFLAGVFASSGSGSVGGVGGGRPSSGAPDGWFGTGGGGGGGTGTMADKALMQTLKSAGFSGQGLITAFAVAKAESGGNARAHNPDASTGDNSYGLFQINMLGKLGPSRRKAYGLSANEDLFDPLTNARIAYDMSKGGSSWGHWSVHPESKSRGAKGSGYEKHLDTARALVGAGVGDPATPGTPSDEGHRGANMTVNGSKTVTINIYPKSTADAHTIAKRVQRILRDEDNFMTVGAS